MRFTFGRKKGAFQHQSLGDDASDNLPVMTPSDESVSQTSDDLLRSATVDQPFPGEGKQADDEDIQAVRQLLKETGVLKYQSSKEVKVSVTSAGSPKQKGGNAEPVWKRRFRSATSNPAPDNAIDLCPFEEDSALDRQQAVSSKIKPALKKTSSSKHPPIPVTKSVSFDEASLNRFSNESPVRKSHVRRGYAYDDTTDEDTYWSDADESDDDDEDNSTISSYIPRPSSKKSYRSCLEFPELRRSASADSPSITDDLILLTKYVLKEASCYECGVSRSRKSRSRRNKA